MTGRYVTATLARDIAARLTDRDRNLLHRVVELRFVTGSQLARMYFSDGDERAARRALLRLTRLDVLERLPRVVGGVRSGSAGYVYRLGLAGQRIALESGWLPNKRRQRAKVPGTMFLMHSLQVAELHTLLIEAQQARRLELLELRAEPACWRSYGGLGAQAMTLKPDSYARIGTGQFEDSYFIEVDMGSEGSRTLDRQLRAYIGYYESGREQAERGVFPRTLWLAPDEKRVEAIAECVRRLKREYRELFAVARWADALDVVAGTSN